MSCCQIWIGDDNLTSVLVAISRRAYNLAVAALCTGIAMSETGPTQDLPTADGEVVPTRTFPSGVAAVGGQIGPYKLLRTLGEGGFGVVFLAEQHEPVKRQVALKVIKPGMDTKQVIARFEAERQALALLDHPNIAHVFDAGATDAGRPYFVMEHVRGVPITEYCDRERLSLEDRLGLFNQVCEAIQHAHQKGIIHRDIKPSNILVTIHENKPLPVVIDFGVAKAIAQRLTEKTLFTEQGQLIGTPEYMSPEQAEMTNQDIDTRSDIYSLGVLLYELLTGALPFDPSTLRHAALGEIQRIIREEEPPRPSTRLSSLGEEATQVARRRRTEVGNLTRRLHKELEWIPLKAIRKRREERYRSASELADDVRNYLSGAPLAAGPPGAAYRIGKFLRRYYWASAVVGLLLTILCSSSVISLFFYRQTKRALDELQFRRASNLAIAEKDATQETVADRQVLVFFLDLWHRFPADSSEGIAASTYFFDVRAQFDPNSVAGMAARFLLDPALLSKKEAELRRKAPPDLLWFLEFLIGEQSYFHDRDRAAQAYDACLETGRFYCDPDDPFMKRADGRLQELKGKQDSSPK